MHVFSKIDLKCTKVYMCNFLFLKCTFGIYSFILILNNTTCNLRTWSSNIIKQGRYLNQKMNSNRCDQERWSRCFNQQFLTTGSAWQFVNSVLINMKILFCKKHCLDKVQQMSHRVPITTRADNYVYLHIHVSHIY